MASVGISHPPVQVACVAVTAVMHLLFLVAFFWMLVEGLLLWSKVVAVSMRPGPRMPLYYATGWGEVPLLLIHVLFPSTVLCMASIMPNTHRPIPTTVPHSPPPPAPSTTRRPAPMS